VRLVGFIIRNNRDARSAENQIRLNKATYFLSCSLVALFLSARKCARNVKAVFGYILLQNVKDRKMENWLVRFASG